MDPAKAHTVQQSFGRCLLNKPDGKEFMDAFYDAFLASDPKIKAKFANTDMRKQKELLRAGLVKLIMLASGSASAKASIDELAVRHDRKNMNIEPAMYDRWVKSLLASIRVYDQKFDAALEKLWHELLNEGIAVMKRAY